MARQEQPEDRSPLAGGCVLTVLGAAVFATVWAASPEAGVLAVWATGTAAIWWSARRRKGTDQPLPSPTEPCPYAEFEQVIADARREGAGVTEFPSGTVVISTPDATNPCLTHVRVLERPER